MGILQPMTMKKIFELYEQGSYKEAIHSIDLDRFSAIGDPATAYILAASYFQIGQYGESLSLLREIESCYSTDSNYLSLYGACLRRSGDLEVLVLSLNWLSRLSRRMLP